MTPTQRRGAQRRTAILAAARDLIAHGGPAAASLKAVGDHVGISHVGVLHHFPSRQLLLLAVQIEADNRAWAALQSAFAGGALRSIEEIVTVAHGVQREPNFTKLTLVLQADALSGTGEVHDYFAERYRFLRHGLTQILLTAQHHGDIRGDADAEIIAARIVAFIDGMPIQYFVEPAAIDIEAVYRSFAHALLAEVAATAAPSASAQPGESASPPARRTSP